MINKNTPNMNESMFSHIDLIRQDSKDVRDFVKRVFSDKEFKSMSKDTDFIKYLKSIYEGTHLDEEHVRFSNRASNGTISTSSVDTTSTNEDTTTEAILKGRDYQYDKKQGVVKISKKNFSKVHKDSKSMIKGKPFMMVLTDKGTSLVPAQFESVVTEASTPKQVQSAVNQVKKQLIAKWKRKGAYENFGQAEVRKLTNKFVNNSSYTDEMNGIRDIISNFDEWASNYTGKNESVVTEARGFYMAIAGLTGTRGPAVEKFIKDYNLDDKKLFNFLKKGKLKDRMNFATALSGRPGNKYQGDFVGMFGESVTPPNSNKVDALKKAVQKINRKYKVQVSTVGPTKGEVEVELGSGNHPDNDYHTIEKLVKKLGIKHYSVFNESSVTEKTTKNPKVWVDGKFSKLIDKLPNSKITRELVLKAAKKFKVNPKDSISFVEFDKMIDLDESTITEGTPFHVLFKVKKDVSNRSIKPATASYKSESDAKKFLKSVKKDGGKGMIVRRNEIKEDKNQITQLKKKVGKSETKFYDALSKVEKKIGKKKYRLFIEFALKDFGVNPKHYDYRTNAAVEEKLFQIS